MFLFIWSWLTFNLLIAHLFPSTTSITLHPSHPPFSSHPIHPSPLIPSTLLLSSHAPPYNGEASSGVASGGVAQVEWRGAFCAQVSPAPKVMRLTLQDCRLLGGGRSLLAVHDPVGTAASSFGSGGY
ncbi:hypothetical protein BDR05DRAFT_954004, partial [Suillus weaverae]